MRLAPVKRNLYSVKIVIYKGAMARKPNTARARVGRAAQENAPLRAPRRRGTPKAVAASEDAPYHHGGLRDALLEAAERVLETRRAFRPDAARGGARGWRLACRRRRIISRDLTGLVSELAADRVSSIQRGDGCGRCLGHCAAGAGDGAGQSLCLPMREAHPGMYGLMFRTERLDMKRPLAV